MSLLLCIDTATDICSVVLSEGNKLLASRESIDDRSHATKLAVFIQEILLECSLSVSNLSAVAISMGPGSYTGLRIGVSTAKGLCYGADVPLLAVSTLEAMCYGIPESFLQAYQATGYLFCPMLDARRMEVYTAVYNSNFQLVQDIEAKILEPDSYHNLFEQSPVLFFGSGAEKAVSIFRHPNSVYYKEFRHSALHMIQPALNKLAQKQFENVAYFEPFYLKDFIATVPKNKVF
jgi:tRNA threonylcarbamoyladenosine biosynthesis protein TsaB